jgi:predicted nucleic acid-binding protein
LKRKVTDGSIDDETYTKAVNFWNLDYHRYLIVPYTEELINSAIEVIKLHAVKTLDSIQMSSACLSGAEICITSDVKMHQKMQLLIKEAVLI